MPEKRLQKTRDSYQGCISAGVLAKTMTYLGDGRVSAIVNGEVRIRDLTNERDTRWLLPSEMDSRVIPDRRNPPLPIKTCPICQTEGPAAYDIVRLQWVMKCHRWESRDSR